MDGWEIMLIIAVRVNQNIKTLHKTATTRDHFDTTHSDSTLSIYDYID